MGVGGRRSREFRSSLWCPPNCISFEILARLPRGENSARSRISEEEQHGDDQWLRPRTAAQRDASTVAHGDQLLHGASKSPLSSPFKAHTPPRPEAASVKAAHKIPQKSPMHLPPALSPAAAVGYLPAASPIWPEARSLARLSGGGNWPAWGLRSSAAAEDWTATGVEVKVG